MLADICNSRNEEIPQSQPTSKPESEIDERELAIANIESELTTLEQKLSGKIRKLEDLFHEKFKYQVNIWY